MTLNLLPKVFDNLLIRDSEWISGYLRWLDYLARGDDIYQRNTQRNA